MGAVCSCCGGREGAYRSRLDTWQKTGVLSLRDSHLSSFPSLSGDLSLIKVVDASNNRIGPRLPPNIPADLPNLTRLTLTNNIIVSLPDTQWPMGLKVLVLDLNQLEQLPEAVAQLPRLEKLSLRANRLRHIPPLTGCTSLVYLNIAFNQLQSLPELPACDDSLEELDARANPGVVTIPSSYGRLQRLKTLTLDNCGVTSVPPQLLLHCALLQTLSLHGCPISANELQATEGFDVFEKRRQSKYSKSIAGNVLMANRGMDEGVDRVTKKQ